MADISGTYELGPGDGRVLVKTGREGLAARAGHDLTIEVTRWSARVTVPDAEAGGLAAAALTAELDLGSLAVREGRGGAKPLTDKDRRDIQAQARKILGDPAQATFTSAKAIPAAGTAASGVIEGTLNLHGTSRPARLQVTSPAPGQFGGSVTVRQTDFGITPYSGFFGTLKLKDEVAVEFEVTIKGALFRDRFRDLPVTGPVPGLPPMRWIVFPSNPTKLAGDCGLCGICGLKARRGRCRPLARSTEFSSETSPLHGGSSRQNSGDLRWTAGTAGRDVRKAAPPAATSVTARTEVTADFSGTKGETVSVVNGARILTRWRHLGSSATPGSAFRLWCISREGNEARCRDADRDRGSKRGTTPAAQAEHPLLPWFPGPGSRLLRRSWVICGE